jgi:hypothetical protein
MAALPYFTFDFNLLQPPGWTLGSASSGLLISNPANTTYAIQFKNPPFDPLLYTPTFYVANNATPASYHPTAITAVNNSDFNWTLPPGSSEAGYTYSLPVGITVPFRLWIS